MNWPLVPYTLDEAEENRYELRQPGRDTSPPSKFCDWCGHDANAFAVATPHGWYCGPGCADMAAKVRARWRTA